MGSYQNVFSQKVQLFVFTWGSASYCFISKVLSKQMFNLQKEYFPERVSSARHIQSLQFGAELATYILLF